MAPTQSKAKSNRRHRLDINKLSKTDRRKFEEARRNYLLAKYGTEEQKKHFAHLTSGEPPYDIFLDMAETTPQSLLEPPPQRDPVEGPAPKPLSDAEANALETDEKPSKGSIAKDEIPLQQSKSEGLFGENGPRIEVPGASEELLEEEEFTDEQYEELEDAGPSSASFLTTTILVQPTAQPVGLTFGQASYIQSSPLDTPLIEPKVANKNELILWWAVLATLVLFALYRIANSRCWRRMHSGRRRSP